jgi:hypothetical protein
MHIFGGYAVIPIRGVAVFKDRHAVTQVEGRLARRIDAILRHHARKEQIGHVLATQIRVKLGLVKRAVVIFVKPLFPLSFFLHVSTYRIINRIARSGGKLNQRKWLFQFRIVTDPTFWAHTG